MTDPEFLEIVAVAPNAIADVHADVRDHLLAFNAEHVGPAAARYQREDFAFAVRDESGELLGGVSGHTKAQWMTIELIWVKAALRGKGLGRRLLRSAEALAHERGCLRAHLETIDFQARPFYEREGYEVFATLEDYPPGHRRYFMYKRLDGPVAPSVLDSIDRSGG